MSETMQLYPKVKSVQPRPEKRLLVTFDNGTRKLYDCNPLLRSEVFAPLQEEWLFRTVRADAGGYGISWTEELDLSEAELWENGRSLDESTASSGPP
jgi:hypothetical protein